MAFERVISRASTYRFKLPSTRSGIRTPKAWLPATIFAPSCPVTDGAHLIRCSGALSTGGAHVIEKHDGELRGANRGR